VLDTPTSEATPIAELSERAIDESSSSFVFFSSLFVFGGRKAFSAGRKQQEMDGEKRSGVAMSSWIGTLGAFRP